MISRWPIRNKLILGIGLLMFTIGGLVITSFIGVYAFRSLAKSLRQRAPELTGSSSLSREVSSLKNTFDLYEKSLDANNRFYIGSLDTGLFKNQFELDLISVEKSFAYYRSALDESLKYATSNQMAVTKAEEDNVQEFAKHLSDVRWQSLGLDFSDPEQLKSNLEALDDLSFKMATDLTTRLSNFADNVRGQYRSWILMNAAMAGLSVVLLAASLWLFYKWILTPLRTLIHGSRRVASGEFSHRIHLASKDEMAELANAMNDMTQRFQEIRDDLDQQVRQRTKEVVRSEQLASVGFLAAGVAHEINNPLASIALCAESLEERINEVVSEDDEGQEGGEDNELSVVRDYLRMMQDEAFRCKEITERLLDFSRLSDVEKQHTDVTALMQSVIDMVKHLGKYKQKTIEFRPEEVVIAPVNAQEMKQVMLNLLTNALDSLDRGGKVQVHVRAESQHAKIVVADDGCGMTEEVRKHLFEPFFTRRRDGQGTGLGMSITYRIVTDHGGDIQAHSEGPGLGSKVTVSIPLKHHEEKQKTRRFAA